MENNLKNVNTDQRIIPSESMNKVLADKGIRNPDSIMESAIRENRTVYIPEINADLHWIYSGEKPWSFSGENSKNIKDYSFQIIQSGRSKTIVETDAIPLSVYCWVEDKKMLITLQCGDGSQLIPEDMKDGYNAYIDFQGFSYSGKNIEDDYLDCESDSSVFELATTGMMLYVEDGKSSWTDHTEQAVRCALDLEDTDTVNFKIIE